MIDNLFYEDGIRKISVPEKYRTKEGYNLILESGLIKKGRLEKEVLLIGVLSIMAGFPIISRRYDRIKPIKGFE